MEKRWTVYLHKGTNKDYKFIKDNWKTAHMGTLSFDSAI